MEDLFTKVVVCILMAVIAVVFTIATISYYHNVREINRRALRREQAAKDARREIEKRLQKVITMEKVGRVSSSYSGKSQFSEKYHKGVDFHHNPSVYLGGGLIDGGLIDDGYRKGSSKNANCDSNKSDSGSGSGSWFSSSDSGSCGGSCGGSSGD